MKRVALFTVLFLLVVSCAPQSDSSFSATSVATHPISPTETFTPTVLSPSQTPSATPEPTLTLTPTATPKPKEVISRKNAEKLKTILTLEDRHGSPHAMFSPDGRFLVAKTSPFPSGRDEPVAKLFFWDIETLQEAPPLETNDRIFFTNLAFDADGQSVLVGMWPSMPQVISLLSLSDGTHLLDIQVSRDSLGRIVERIALSPDGQWIVLGFADGQVEVYAKQDGQLVFEDKIQSGNRVVAIQALAFSPDSTLLAAGGTDKTIYLWNTSDWSQTTTFPSGKAPIFDLAFSPDGSLLAAAEGGIGGRVSIWNTQAADAQSPVATIPFSSFSVEFSPDGFLLVTGGENGYLAIWRTDNYQLVAEFPAHKTRIEALDFSPDGQFLASGSISTYRQSDKTGDKASIKLWKVPAP